MQPPLSSHQLASVRMGRVGRTDGPMALVENRLPGVNLNPRRAGGAVSRSLLRTALIGYVVGLLAAVPVALPCWNGFLRAHLESLITVEQIHLLQYLGLGLLAALTVQAERPGVHLRWILIGTTALVGLLDETVQSLLPQRFFQWSDVILNWAGGLLGMSLASMIKFRCKLIPLYKKDHLKVS